MVILGTNETYGNQLSVSIKSLAFDFRQTPKLDMSLPLISTSHLFGKGHILTFRIVTFFFYKLSIFVHDFPVTDIFSQVAHITSLRGRAPVCKFYKFSSVVVSFPFLKKHNVKIIENQMLLKYLEAHVMT